jgi:hypothetical protein
MAGKKVLVKSRFREVVARTTRDFERDKDGKIKEINGFRQFHNHSCYMSPSEAAFLVDSTENQRYINAGFAPMYYYPAGYAYAVDENLDGPLGPPLQEGALSSTDPKTIEAARMVMQEAEQRLAAKEKGLNPKDFYASDARSGVREAVMNDEPEPMAFLPS